MIYTGLMHGNETGVGSPGTTPRVLIASGEATHRDRLRHALDEQVEVLECGDATVMHELFGAHQIDCLLLDEALSGPARELLTAPLQRQATVVLMVDSDDGTWLSDMPSWVAECVPRNLSSDSELRRVVRSAIRQSLLQRAIADNERNMARESARLHALRALARGMAHDLNNQLSVVTSFAQFAKEELTEDEVSIGDDLDEVLQAGGRASELAKRLLTLTSPLPEREVSTLVAELTRRTLPLLRTVLGRRATLELRCDEESGSVTLADAELEALLVLLVSHAKEHSLGTTTQPARLMLEITTTSSTDAAGQVQVLLSNDESNTSGAPWSAGPGLRGKLAIADALCAAAGGSVCAQTTAGATTTRVRLPLTADPT